MTQLLFYKTKTQPSNDPNKFTVLRHLEKAALLCFSGISEKAFKNNKCEMCVQFLNKPPTHEQWLTSKNETPISFEVRQVRSRTRRCANSGLPLQMLPVAPVGFEGGTWHCWSKEILYRVRVKEDVCPLNVTARYSCLCFSLYFTLNGKLKSTFTFSVCSIASQTLRQG